MEKQPESASAASAQAEQAKPKKSRNKRKTSPAESSVRTDLFHLSPNAGKALALERLFEHYRSASVEIAAKLWQAVLDGEPIVGWRIVSESNPFHASSTLIQPAIAQAKGSLAGHLGWLEKDVGKLVSKLVRRLSAKCRAMPEAEAAESMAAIDRFAHELRAINAKQAWRRKSDRHGENVMKVGKELMPASPRAYATSSFLFGLAAGHRNPPDASLCQVELTPPCVRIVVHPGFMSF
jgi:hypothetical protein